MIFNIAVFDRLSVKTGEVAENAASPASGGGGEDKVLGGN